VPQRSELLVGPLLPCIVVFLKRNDPMTQGASFLGTSIGSSTIFGSVESAVKSIKELVYDVDVCTAQ
jgi:hypothetical protein